MNNPSTLLVAVERCQLCGRSRKQFTCQKCISTGNFSSSQSNVPASYALKKKRAKVAYAVRNATLLRIEPKLTSIVDTDKKKSQLILLVDRIEAIKNAKKRVEENTNNIKEENKVAHNKISERKTFIQRLKEKTEKLKTNKQIEEKKIKHEANKEKLLKQQVELQKLRVFHIESLLKDIFPMSQRDVYPEFGTPPQAHYTSQFSISDVISETTLTAESELEEATRHVHVGGRWISQTTEQTEHTIVDVGMPSSGDFIKYYEWLKSYRNEPKTAESQSSLHTNNILSIPASLMYTAQLNDCAAYFLGVNLPHRMEYLNFSLLQISRQKLYETVNKLAENIMRMCFSQHVQLTSLHPNRLIQNLQICFSPENLNLGSYGSFETFEFYLFECPFDSDSSAEELNYDSEDSGSSFVNEQQEDWDQLMDLHDDVSRNEAAASTLSIDQRSLSSSASGLVTSAAASVASALWSWKR